MSGLVRRLVTGLVSLSVASALLIPGWVSEQSVARAQADGVTMEWFGWSHFRFTSINGKVIHINPFVRNPDSPITVDDLTRVDLILVPDGHGDEVGSTVEIAQKTGARTLSPFELGSWFIDQGVPQAQVNRSNPGNRYLMDGITVRVVSTNHGSGLPAGTTQNVPYGGPAAGFFITFENGWTVYFAGSAPASQDQAMWAQMCRPDAAILHLGGNMEPMDFAMQVKLLMTDNPNLRTIFPHHHRVIQQPGQTTIAEAQSAINSMGLGMTVTDQALGQVYTFSK